MSAEQEGTPIRSSETDKKLWATRAEVNCSTGNRNPIDQERVTGERGAAPWRTTPASLRTLKGESNIILHIRLLI